MSLRTDAATDALLEGSVPGIPALVNVHSLASGILAAMEAFVTAGAGFLLAVLWFDLMFDVRFA